MTTIVGAVVIGVAVLLAGSLPWTLFGRIGGLGAQDGSAGAPVPWAILPMTLYLWLYWRFISGAWDAGLDGASRRANLRAHPLSAGLWFASLTAGLVGFAALLAMLSFAARLVHLPASAPIVTSPHLPVLTVVLLLAMQSIVAGVTEEAAFRGCMQSPIERRYGIVIAILVSGVVFGLLHFPTHPGDVLVMLPYYVAVSAVYGGLTWAADSILPALVLHSAGDVVVLTRWWATGRPEWQLTATAPGLVWDGGIDAAFVITTIALVVLAAVTVRAYRRVHDLRMTAQLSQPVAAPA